MNRMVFFICLLVCGIRTVCAQVDQAMQDRIYNIQMDESYLFAEGMQGSEQASFDLVLSALLEKANEVRQQTNLPPLSLDQLRGLTQKLSTPMGGSCYVFGYARRADIKALKAGGGGGKKPTIAVNLPTHVETNEPVHPVEQPIEQPTQQATELPAVQPAQQPTEPVAPANVDSYYASMAAELLQLGDANELLRYIRSYIEGGQLRDYNSKIRGLSDIPTDAYVVLVSAEDRTISAILSPSGTNMATGQADNIRNYKGHQVIWYR